MTTSWNTEIEGFCVRAEADAALAAAKEHAPTTEPVLLGLHDGVWDEDLDGAEAFLVQDGSGSWSLFPADAADPDASEDIAPVPGFVWVFTA